MKKVKAFFSDLESNISVVLLLIILTLLTIQVLGRFVFHVSNSWSEEVSRYMFIWISYLTASSCVISNSHIRIDALVNVWPKKVRPAIIVIGLVIFTVYSVAVTVFGAVYTKTILDAGQRSLGTGIQMWIVYAAVPVCHAAMVYRLVRLMMRIKKDPEKYLTAGSVEDEAAAATEMANLD